MFYSGEINSVYGYDKAIQWYSRILDDCNAEIRRLQSAKELHIKRQEKAANLSRIIKEYTDSDLSGPVGENYLIAQGYKKKDVPAVARILTRRATARKNAARNAEIYRLSKQGVTKTDLAAQFDLSRTQIYKIISVAERQYN